MPWRFPQLSTWHPCPGGGTSCRSRRRELRRPLHLLSAGATWSLSAGGGGLAGMLEEFGTLKGCHIMVFDSHGCCNGLEDSNTWTECAGNHLPQPCLWFQVTALLKKNPLVAEVPRGRGKFQLWQLHRCRSCRSEDRLDPLQGSSMQRKKMESYCTSNCW